MTRFTASVSPQVCFAAIFAARQARIAVQGWAEQKFSRRPVAWPEAYPPIRRA